MVFLYITDPSHVSTGCSLFSITHKEVIGAHHKKQNHSRAYQYPILCSTKVECRNKKGKIPLYKFSANIPKIVSRRIGEIVEFNSIEDAVLWFKLQYPEAYTI